MDLAIRRAADLVIKVEEVKIKEEVFVIKEEAEEKVNLAMVKPLEIEPVAQEAFQAKPTPSTSRAAVAEVRVHAPPPAQDVKFDP